MLKGCSELRSFPLNPPARVREFRDQAEQCKHSAGLRKSQSSYCSITSHWSIGSISLFRFEEARDARARVSLERFSILRNCIAGDLSVGFSVEPRESAPRFSPCFSVFIVRNDRANNTVLRVATVTISMSVSMSEFPYEGKPLGRQPGVITVLSRAEYSVPLCHCGKQDFTTTD